MTARTAFEEYAWKTLATIRIANGGLAIYVGRRLRMRGGRRA
jgi:hypothetical protein